MHLMAIAWLHDRQSKAKQSKAQEAFTPGIWQTWPMPMVQSQHGNGLIAPPPLPPPAVGHMCQAAHPDNIMSGP